MARPPNSSTREHESPDPSNPLDRTGETSKEFWEAKIATKPREKPTEYVPEQDNSRRTSLAKDSIERRADNLLEQFDETSKEFNRVSDFDQDSTQYNETRNSSMIEKDQPELKPRPSKDIAERADKISFDDRWDREQQDAAQERSNQDTLER